ncbi:MAG: hypothetical protein JKX90_02765 [Colwellia sp.]|nr:hypothetical protein [Colwellia sp.]
MSPYQQKKLQELSLIFSQGRASPKQIQQLSALLAQINQISEQLILKVTHDIDLKNRPF